ncbi:MAG TPA: hypothetical protein V6C99_06445 [Oculatellaceae cyanobacterium]|jgi:hypothetical protein
MNKNLKIGLMFAPLGIFAIVLAVGVYDLRHPSVTIEQCLVTDVGLDVTAHKRSGRMIYRQSENALHDLSLRCQKSGDLRLNDLQLRQTPVKRGQMAEVVHKQFSFLPERWLISVHLKKTAPVPSP